MLDDKFTTGHLETAAVEEQLAVGEDYAPKAVQDNVDALNHPENAQAAKRYKRKLDMIILPTITLLYFFEYLDRGNAAVSNKSLTRTASLT
jgi:hypothetical protein